MGIETAAIPLLMQGAGAGMQAYGAYSNSKATKQAYEQQAQVNRNNAQIAGWQAEDALRRGVRSASTARMRTNQLKGNQRASLAAKGVDLGEGSALQLLSDTDYFGDVDATTITDNAAREAWAIRQQAANFNSEASLLKSRADSENPLMAGGMSLLTSAGKVASNWYTPSSVTRSGDGMSQGDRRRMGVS
jgi:hypothetical protein